jgi:thiamine biosynthesis lipoprotein
MLATGCSRGEPVYELRGGTMGTSYSIAIVAPPAATDLESLQLAIEGRLADITLRMSTYEPASELSRFNAHGGTEWQTVSQALCDAIHASLQLSRETGGAFDITVGRLVDLWGFGPAGSRNTTPPAAEIEEALQLVGADKIETDCDVPAIKKTAPGVSADLSAYAKGLAVDELAGLLDERQIANYLVEIGGEIRAQGSNSRGNPWRIAVERPATNERGVQRVIDVTNRAVATSGDYRNFYTVDGARYSHTIDPQTGRPVTHQLAAVTVIAEQAARADALATALLVLGPRDGVSFATDKDIAALFLVYRDGEIDEIEAPAFAAVVAH